MEGLLAQVRLRIGDQTLTAVITRDAVDELKLRRGDEALAIVKSTEVMIAREAPRPPAGRSRRAGAAGRVDTRTAMDYAGANVRSDHARHHHHLPRLRGGGVRVI